MVHRSRSSRKSDSWSLPFSLRLFSGDKSVDGVCGMPCDVECDTLVNAEKCARLLSRKLAHPVLVTDADNYLAGQFVSGKRKPFTMFA